MQLKKKFDREFKEHLTAEEFNKINDIIKESAQNNNENWDYLVFFNISYYTGLRPKEILSLTWNDFENDKLKINPRILKNPKEDIKNLYMEKINGDYYISLSEKLKNIINEHLLRNENNNTFFLNNYICGGEKKLNIKDIHNKNNEYISAAGIRKFNIHEFRRSILANNYLKQNY